tara:strand:+ start:764 stop:976 length:213 start_codon:yes stop_codon:yes gene_type:complete
MNNFKNKEDIIDERTSINNDDIINNKNIDNNIDNNIQNIKQNLNHMYDKAIKIDKINTENNKPCRFCILM